MFIAEKRLPRKTSEALNDSPCAFVANGYFSFCFLILKWTSKLKLLLYFSFPFRRALLAICQNSTLCWLSSLDLVGVFGILHQLEFVAFRVMHPHLPGLVHAQRNFTVHVFRPALINNCLPEIPYVFHFYREMGVIQAVITWNWLAKGFSTRTGLPCSMHSRV